MCAKKYCVGRKNEEGGNATLYNTVIDICVRIVIAQLLQRGQVPSGVDEMGFD